MEIERIKKRSEDLVLYGLAKGLLQAIEDDELLDLGQHERGNGPLAETRKLGILLEVLHNRGWKVDHERLNVRAACAPNVALDGNCVRTVHRDDNTLSSGDSL